jgi:hypothetical protein
VTENTDTELPLKFAVASSPPPGLNATDRGWRPVANGDPATWMNTGVADAGAAPASQPATTPDTTTTTTTTRSLRDAVLI